MDVFNDYINETVVDLPFGKQDVSEGAIEHKGLNHTSYFEVLPAIVSRDEVESILALVDDADLELDSDPDTVDVVVYGIPMTPYYYIQGMATHEIFVESTDLYKREGAGWMPGMKLDTNSDAMKQRKPLRAKLKEIMDPVLSERITPYIRQRFPDVCGPDVTDDRQCTPCYSLIRRYRSGERQSHASHHDGHALVTAVISLSDYGSEYRGGLYVATGDDSVEHEWFEECAVGGSAVCEMLYATKVGKTPGLTEAEQAAQVLLWNQKSAEQGLSESMVKIARAYLKQLPSTLAYNREEAKRTFRRAIKRNAEPEAYFGLAQLLLDDGSVEASVEVLEETVSMLEGAAAKGNVFAMFNLGIAHLYGYGVPRRDPDLAAEWFGASGLPEGMVCVGMHKRANGNVEDAKVWETRARTLGYGSTWRQKARKTTGSGGVGGVELNLKWPPLSDGTLPPTW